MGWLIGGILSFSMFFLGVLEVSKEQSNSKLMQSMVFFAFMIFFFVKYRNSKNGTTARRKREKAVRREEAAKKSERLFLLLYGKHQAGLSIAQNAECQIEYGENKFIFRGSGNSFNLNFDKITDICVKTDKEIQSQYVSSIGKTISGAAAFGTFGAIRGGQARKISTTTIRNYLIFTYQKNNNIAYISFQIFDTSKAKNWISTFTQNHRMASGNIEL